MISALLQHQLANHINYFRLHLMCCKSCDDSVLNVVCGRHKNYQHLEVTVESEWINLTLGRDYTTD